MPIKNPPFAFNETHSTAMLPLGTLVETTSDYTAGIIPGVEHDDGEQLWVYVFNDDAATDWAAGDCIVQDTSADDPYHGVLAASATARSRHGTLGFAQFAIPFGEYGLILRDGVGKVKADDAGADQDGAALVPAGGTTVGGVDVVTAGTDAHCVVAEGLEAGGAAGSTFRARISVR